MLKWFLAFVMFATVSSASAQEAADANVRMARTIAEICHRAMRTGQEVTLEQFGDQFTFDEVENGVIWLKHARGQPWIRLAINGTRGASCGANFSSSAPNSMQVATNLAREIRRLPNLRAVSVPAMRAAFTFTDTPEPFDHERHPYIAYINVAGYQSFFFVPASSSIAE